ncbi:hypothetical protein TNCV_1943321 [Trichonephila clavipes]|nr:hypothetical protein TNCV_1943321 [Trichonephila clavipes]
METFIPSLRERHDNNIYGLENSERFVWVQPDRLNVLALFGNCRRSTFYTGFFSKDVKATLRDAVSALVYGIYLNHSRVYSKVFQQIGMSLMPKSPKGTLFWGTEKHSPKTVTDQLKAIPISKLHQCYEEWKKRLQRCVASEGNYFEGDNVEL